MSQESVTLCLAPASGWLYVSSLLWGVSRTFPFVESLLGLWGRRVVMCLIIFCVHVKRSPYIQKLTTSKQSCLMSSKWYLAPPLPREEEIFTPTEMGQQWMLYKPGRYRVGGMPFKPKSGLQLCCGLPQALITTGAVRWKVYPCIALAAKVISQGIRKKTPAGQKQVRFPISVVIFNPGLI